MKSKQSKHCALRGDQSYYRHRVVKLKLCFRKTEKASQKGFLILFWQKASQKASQNNFVLAKGISKGISK